MASRTPLPVQPNLYMTDTAGRPLDGGKVYFGESGKDPETYPIDIFYDELLTIAAPQPVITKNGFLSASGNTIGIYGTATSYSVKVLDAHDVQVLYISDMTRLDDFGEVLAAESARAQSAEQELQTTVDNAVTTTQQSIAELEAKTADDVSILQVKDASLQNQINSVGGGKKAYTTEALMIADKANIAAHTSIDVTNDPTTSKNGTYTYNGTVFTKSVYDPQAVILSKTVNAFDTKSIMEASGLPDGSKAVVDNDVQENNGFYKRAAGVWINTGYNPQEFSIAYTDEKLSTISDAKAGKNLYNKDNKVVGRYIDSEGKLMPVQGWSTSEHIPVIAGKTYTVSATARRQGLAFFTDEDTNTSISGSYNVVGGTVTVTAPATANFLVINVDSNTIVSSNIQVEQAASATAYEPYMEIRFISPSALPETVVFDDDLQAAISAIATKDYEVTYLSKNLFDKSKIIQKQYVDNAGALVKADTLTGWSTSHLIPVVAGETYTLSGTRGRAGLSFFASADNLTAALLYNATLPASLTVTAPVGANFAMFNISQPSNLDYSNLQFEKGTSATSYVEYQSFIGVNSDFVIGATDALQEISIANFEVFGNNNARISIANDLDLKINISLTKPDSYDVSNVLNFSGDYSGNTVIRTLTDDVSPLRMDGTTVGANHGYLKTVITSSGHGKTNADVGSIWTDGAAQWVLIAVTASDKILVTARNSNSSLSANSLTHVSGAANTASINSTTKTTNQWYPAIKNRKLSLFVDGVRVDASTAKNYSYTDNVALHETYEIMSKTDIVEWLILNGGVERKSYNAAPSVLYNNSYVFDKDGGCVIYTSATAYKSVPFQDYMGTQSVPMDSTTRFYYVPKTIAFTQDSTNYDFTKLQDVSVAPVSSIVFFPNKNEVGANPVDRLIQFDPTVGYATGFLPLLDAEPSKRLTNASKKYLEIRGGTLKVYPSLIDTTSKTTLEAGDSYAAIAYRKYFKRDSNRTAKYVVRSNIADFLYLDWHSAKTDVIELPEDLVGRAFTVHEGSSNVTLLSAFATNNIAVKVDNSKSYGYLVLRFDK